MSRGVTKGIVLAGGKGSRLYPSTLAVCKQLLPIYDKPLVYYPLDTLMQFGIRDILIISTPQDIGRFEALFGDGRALGLRIEYAIQPRPEGIAQALLIGKGFIGCDSVALVLGDNIFYGVEDYTSVAREFERGGVVFAYRVRNPQRYGVVAFGPDDRPEGIEEKPATPPSDYAVTGLYFYDSRVVEIARGLKPSARGELEITDINNRYLSEGSLRVIPFAPGVAWLDTGTCEAMLDAANFIAAIQNRQKQKIGCIEETALRMGFIDPEQLRIIADTMTDNDYRRYLLDVIEDATRGR